MYHESMEKLRNFTVFSREKTVIFSQCYGFMCVLNVEIRVIWVKNKLFLRFMYVFYEMYKVNLRKVNQN